MRTIQDWYYTGEEKGWITVFIHDDGSCQLPKDPWDYVLDRSLFPSVRSARLTMAKRGFHVIEVKE